jgi:hypothetical protein
MALHVTAVALVIMGLLWSCRFVYRRSRFAGLIFAAGLAIRATGAAFFLVISYYNLPFMTRLQMGNGFWTLASDAQEYYRLGSLVAEQWQETIAPGYVGPMALWMRAVGVNPASPVLFALVMHAVAVVTLVAAFGRNPTHGARQALHFCVAAFSFSPMLIYACVFGLKDVFSTTLIVMLAVAYLTLVAAPWTRATLRTTLLAAAGVAVAVWFLAGFREYFAILLWAAMAVTHAGCMIAAVPSRLRAVLQGAVMLPAVALVIAFGAAGGYPRFVRGIAASVPEAVVERKAPMAHGGIDELDRRRQAIDNYGGDSMITSPQTSANPSRLKAVAVGVAVVFVPISALEGLSIVDLHIGTAARLIANADTLVLDVTAVMALWVLAANRARVNPVPVIFAAALAVLVALPLGYVMTNYGTLIRLRLMVAAPIWLLTLALAPGPTRAATSTAAPRPSAGA